MRFSLIFILALFPLLLFGEEQLEGEDRFVQEDNFHINGYFWSRYETRESEIQAQDNQFTSTRFSVISSYRLNDELSVVANPQFSKIWGNIDDETKTSGALNDPEVNIHQAYVSKGFGERNEFIFGRKEINLGDELLVGGVGWHYIGRSFDLVEFRRSFGPAGEIRAFHSNIVENSKAEAPREDFSGLYFKSRPGTFEEVDLYWLKKTATQGDRNVRAYGARAVKEFFLGVVKFEYAQQTVQLLNKEKHGEYLYNLEAQFGPRYLEGYVGLNSASQDFDQLYPTGHKWLGFADLFSRRNISSFILGANTEIGEKFNASLRWHSFSRTDTDSPAYDFGEQSYGLEGSERKIASETDLVLQYKLEKDFKILCGYSFVRPLAYFKDQGINEDIHWGFAQMIATF